MADVNLTRRRTCMTSYMVYKKEYAEHQTDVHGNTAQLKWQIPPDIVSAIDCISQCPLFPEFACKHHKPCQTVEW